jgi:hypothetical protein
VVPQSLTAFVLVVFLASVAIADDFKTIDGKEYKNTKVSGVEPDGLVLTSKFGISKVYFVELPKEVQERFHYDAAKAAQFTTADQAAVAQFNQQQAEIAQAIKQRQVQEVAARQQEAQQQQQREAAAQRQIELQQQAALKKSAQSGATRPAIPAAGNRSAPDYRTQEAINQQMEEERRIANERNSNEQSRRQAEAYDRYQQQQVHNVNVENARIQKEHERWERETQRSSQEYQRFIRDISRP